MGFFDSDSSGWRSLAKELTVDISHSVNGLA